MAWLRLQCMSYEVRLGSTITAKVGMRYKIQRKMKNDPQIERRGKSFHNVLFAFLKSRSNLKTCVFIQFKQGLTLIIQGKIHLIIMNTSTSFGGFNIHYGQIKPPKDVDVFMISGMERTTNAVIAKNKKYRLKTPEKRFEMRGG